MNLTWHLMKKDLRRLRLPLALFSLLVAGKIIFYLAISGVLRAPDLDWLRRLSSGPELLLRTLAEPLFVYFLMGWLVFEDSPVTPDAHWITRPVSGGQLFRAKLAGAVLALVLWPLLLNLGWWLACGCNGSEVGGSAAEFVAIHLSLVALGLAVAALTDGYGRFVLWSFAGLAVFMMLQVILNLAGSGGAQFSRMLAAMATAGLVALGVAAHQFVTRRRRRSLALAVGGIVVIAGITAFWRWNFMNEGAPRLAPEQPASAGVSVKLTGPARYYQLRTLHFAKLPFQIDGVPAANLIGRVDVRGDWSFAGAQAWTSRASVHDGMWAREMARRLLGLKPLQPEGQGTVSLPFSRPLAERAAKEPAAFHAVIGIDFFRAEILAELPLREGTGSAAGCPAYTLSYLSIGPVPERRADRKGPATSLNGVSLLLTERSARGFRQNTRMSPVASYYVLVNRATGEIFQYDPVRSGPEAVSIVNQVKVACWRLTFLTGDAPARPADLTLAVISFEGGESLSRELRVEPIAFEPLPVADSVPPAARANVTQPRAALAVWVGTYALSDGRRVTITLNDAGDQLFGEATGQPKAPLMEVGENMFFAKEARARVEFVKNAAGAVTQLIVHQDGRDLVAPRVP